VSFLGFDVGGSNCRYEWWPEGSLPGGDAASVQPAVHGIEATVAGLGAALELAMHTARPTAAVLALAGVGDRATAQVIVDGLRSRGFDFPLAVVGDVLAAAAAGLQDGQGLLLWSGTGSFAVARAEDGTLHRVGGRGYLLGDQGSGYDLVRRAAAQALLAVDGLAPATALTAALTEAFAAPHPGRLGAVLQRLAPGEVARRLPVVFDVAAGGDLVANEVIAAGVDGLVALAAAALRRAGLDWRTAGRGIAVAIGGGVLVADCPVTGLLRERLRALGSGAPRIVPPRAAAFGAAFLARGFHERRQPEAAWVHDVAL
jgi:N-acetylglucosamine kinase-like BadF-type ATPase